MSDQDSIPPSTRLRRSRKASVVSNQNGTQRSSSQRPRSDDKDSWKAYWKVQGQHWRTEPEIDVERQKFLARRRAIAPNIEQGIYPFKDIKLSRADIEWLLATHDDGRGPVDWTDENQRDRMGLDLRGADLRQANLSKLPLIRIRGGLSLDESSKATREQMEAAAIHLEEGELSAVHLEGSDLIGAYLKKSNLKEAHLENAVLRNAHLERVNLKWAHLEKAILIEAHLERCVLTGAHLEYARLIEAHLEGADLAVANLEKARCFEVHLEGAFLMTAHLEGAELQGAHLEWAVFYQAHLEDAWLNDAHLQGADLRRTHLEGAKLVGAHLEGKDVPPDELRRVRQCFQEYPLLETVRPNWEDRLDFPEILPPADLQEAFFNNATRLNGIILGDEEHGFVKLADVSWSGVNLAVVDWWQINMLGDELAAHREKASSRTERINNYEKAVRSNRQLANALRDQGLNELSTRYAFRAQVLRRKVVRLLIFKEGLSLGSRMRRFWEYIFSWLLAILAGYGYKAQRSLLAYLFVILGFTIAYYILGQTVGPSFSPLGALVFSVTSFHGRGFFPGGIRLDDPITALAAFEAVVGLSIEVSLIATFTQRFFGK
jgi:uncharacterized protein YjbI with pentapeptide repeats